MGTSSRLAPPLITASIVVVEQICSAPGLQSGHGVQSNGIPEIKSGGVANRNKSKAAWTFLSLQRPNFGC